MGQKWNLSLLNSLHRSSWTYSTPLDSIQERAKGLVFRLPPNPSLFVPNLPIAILFCPLIILFCPSLPHSSLNHSSCLICLQWQAAPDLLSPAERPSHLHSQQHITKHAAGVPFTVGTDCFTTVGATRRGIPVGIAQGPH